MKNVNVVGIDIGYGYTKVYADKVSRVIPSQVSRIRPRGVFGTHQNLITVNGQAFVVGEDIETFGDHSVSSDFIGTPEYLALLGYSLSMAKTPCNILVLGLPPGFYDEARIAKLTRIISMSKIHSNGDTISIPRTIKFVPQGAGIYFDYINSTMHRNRQPKGNVVIIDVGHFTVDLVLFSDLKYVAGAARSVPLGVSKLFNDVKDAFSKKHGVFLDNNDSIMRLVKDGSYTHFGKTYNMDINALVDEYINHKILKAIGKYAAELRESTNKSVDEIVIGGGGVSYIGHRVGQAVIIEDAQMSNARGYYQFGRRLTEETETIQTEDVPLHVVSGT